jgi:hypothetical protein
VSSVTNLCAEDVPASTLLSCELEGRLHIETMHGRVYSKEASRLVCHISPQTAILLPVTGRSFLSLSILYL